MLKKTVLVIMTKWPATLRCKSRLSNDIGAQKASCIQKKLIFHTISAAKKLNEKLAIDITLAVEGIGLKKARRWGNILGIKNVSLQGKGNLGERMRRQLIKIRREKNTHRNTDYKVIIIGSDLPMLSTNELESAFQELENNHFVIGPSKDGGYWLIGLSKELLMPLTCIPFEGIHWGGDSVLSQTLYQIKRHKLNYKVINTHNDIDNILDLKPWLRLK